MPKPINTQSQKRSEESLGSLFENKSVPEKNYIFLKSSSDEGVIRNGGRNGARFAPQSLLATFKRLNKSPLHEVISFGEFEVANSEEEKINFREAQLLQSKRISPFVKRKKSATICHLGGGHDHIYPLLTALKSEYKKIIVINIDAHADTRVDQDPHSGTPFRQFALDYDGDFALYQIGLHPFANSHSTLSDLERGKMTLLWKNETITGYQKVFAEINDSIDDNTAVVFSLDADALAASQVPGVSALNADGISIETLTLLWGSYKALELKHSPILGVYELNPVHDNLGSLSMRSLSTFLYQTLV